MANGNSADGGSKLFLTAIFMLAASVLGLQEMDRNKTKGSKRGFIIFTIVWASLLLLSYVFAPIRAIFKVMTLSA